MNRLPGPLYKELMDAIISAFPTYEQLEQMVRFQLDEELAQLTQNGTLTDVVFGLIGWAESHSSVMLLLDGARKSNSKNSDLIYVEEKCKNLLEQGNTYSQDSTHFLGNTAFESLKSLLKKENIQSVSLILDFSSSYPGIEYSISGKSIYLVSLQANTSQDPDDKQYNHLNIYLPVQSFNLAEHISEKDEMFISGLICYIANSTKLKRFAIEKFGAIPAVFKNFENLEELRILDCKDSQVLPRDIVHLISLQKLVIQDTGLEELPPSIFELSNLISLDLSGNQLRSIPPSIARLSKLASLTLLNNPLEHLPQEIYQLKNLEKLVIDDRLKSSVQIQKRMYGNSLQAERKENLGTSGSRFQYALNWIFISLPEIIGRLFFDVFGQHEPAEMSTLILGYLLILFVFVVGGLVFVVLVLVVFGLMSPSTLWNILEKIWQFFSIGK